MWHKLFYYADSMRLLKDKNLKWEKIMRQFLYEVQDDVEKTTEELLNELQKAEDLISLRATL